MKFGLIECKNKKYFCVLTEVKMLGNVLPASIGDAVNKIPYNSLCELRLRANSPAIVNILGENYYLTPNSLTKNMDSALTISKGEIYSILNKISNN